MSDVFRDFLFTLRTWRRAPAFAVVTVLTLGLGIGLTVTIFSAVNGVLLRPLPYSRPDGLANIWVDLGVGNQSLPAVSPFDFRDYQRRARTFESFAAASGGNVVGAAGVITGGGAEPERVTVSTVTANFFPLLGIQPVVGRQFEIAEEAVQGPSVVMLSHGLWRRRFGGDPTIVDRTIELDGVQHHVAGVLPEEFRLLLPAEAFLVQDSEIWKPLQFDYSQPLARNFTFFTVFGRLRPDVTFDQAQAEMTSIAGQLRAEHAVHESSDMRIRVIPLQQDIVKAARPALLALLGTVSFVLLIACANVAHLLLARGLGREREIAVRTALGASRWRVIRQLAMESLLLAVAGTVAGLVLAAVGLDLLRFAAPASLPRAANIQIDGTVLAFTTVVCLATALLFGAAPAMHWSRVNPMQALRTSASSSVSQARLRSLLVVAEIALSVVLVVGAGLMIRSFVGLQQVKPGFEPDHVLTFQLALPRGAYPDGAARRQFVRALEERLRALPGAEAVGAISQLPLTGSGPLSPYAYNEQTARNWESATADGRVITPGYFRAMGTRLMAGRFFTDQEPLVGSIIIDDTLAERAFPGRSAVGQKLQVSPTGQPNMYAEVVGVVEHMRILDLGRPVRGQIYRPLVGPPVVAIAVRTRSEPEALMTDVRSIVRALDSNLAIDRLQPMTAYVGDALAQSRFSLLLMSVFGALAIVLATIGVYGVISYSLSQRTREIGIRMALGEQPSHIRNLIVRQGMVLVAVSFAIGIPGAMLVARLLGDLLYGIPPTDPPTYLAAGAVLGLAALVACYVPARRVARVTPMLALRSE
jgi:putative ABC transport system permease protein